MERFVIAVAHAMLASTVAVLMLTIAACAILFTLICAPQLARLRNRRFHDRLARIQAPPRRR